MQGSQEFSDSPSRHDGHFVTTHWSLIRRAGQPDSPEAQAALGELCRTYWYPLYVFIRRRGHRPQDAEDLTQAFFAKLLDKKYVTDAEQEKGKFRTFLLTALKRFLANEWDREHAQKRGGFQPILSIDQERAEARFEAEPVCEASPDVLFDRQWATALLDQDCLRSMPPPGARACLNSSGRG
jgi:RNA polymerase sigma-70 factor (ECF subfamily)